MFDDPAGTAHRWEAIPDDELEVCVEILRAWGASDSQLGELGRKAARALADIAEDWLLDRLPVEPELVRLNEWHAQCVELFADAHAKSELNCLEAAWRLEA